jgi:predicted RNA-binding Zn ribbon-like protein
VATVVHAVAFLEDTQIRAWTLEQRGPLREHSATWTTTLNKYLAELQCLGIPRGAGPFRTFMESSRNVTAVVSWLLEHAMVVKLEAEAEHTTPAAAEALSKFEMAAAAYGEGVGGGGMDVDGEEGAPAAPGAGKVPDVPAEVRELVDKLCEVLGVEGVAVESSEVAASQLRACAAIVRRSLLPQLDKRPTSSSADSSSAPSSSSSSSSSSSASAAAAPAGRAALGSATSDAQLSDFPAGVATGDAVLDRVIVALRMLYVADLRELQDRANEILETVQEFTADPRTNAKLGKVGY